MDETEDEAPPSLAPAEALPEELARGYVTRDLPAISGEARLVPEDFVVEEVPLYEACGDGEHLYVTVEKRGISTHETIAKLARLVGVRERDVGYAGMKDVHAVARQTLSFQLAREDGLAKLDDSRIKVIKVGRHKNKLKLGHLRGNRFTIRLRGTSAGDDERARAVLERLSRTGAANYFGLQRFGNRRNNHRLGLELVRTDARAFLRELLGDESFPKSGQAERTALSVLAREPEAHEKAVRAIPIKWRRLYTSALQSLLFNRYLSRRLDRIDRLEAGEVAFLNRNGAAFLVEDAAKEQPRCDAHELSPSGPMFGEKLLRPKEGSGPRQDEDAVLGERGLGSPDLGDALGASPRGERRSLRVLVSDATVQGEGDALVLSFFLPKGCYATSVLEELLKRPVA